MYEPTWVNNPEDVGPNRYARHPNDWNYGLLDRGSIIGQTLEGDYVVISPSSKVLATNRNKGLPAGSRFVITPDKLKSVTSDEAYERLDAELMERIYRPAVRFPYPPVQFAIMVAVALAAFLMALPNLAMIAKQLGLL